MRVLVIGSGGREHALIRRLLLDREVSELLAAPGNPGIAQIARTVSVNPIDIDALVALAGRERIDLTVVGPEAPLGLGLVDRFAAAGRLVVGPTAAAARLETSKVFAKAFMTRHRVPTARFRTCASLDDALEVVRGGEFSFPMVLKADGLAAGKGVVIAEDRAAAESAAIAAMRDRRFGDAGSQLVIEECLVGPEVSYFVLTDGSRAACIGTAQDHKRIFDDDRGPNTGGMGAFAPNPRVTGVLNAQIMREVVGPVITGMADEGHPYRGFLYVGLMLTADGPKVIEFNARLGDPEAQVILPLIDEALAPLLADVARGDLKQDSVRLGSDKTVCVVLASRGYPETSESGQPISGIDAASAIAGVAVYHAGTAVRNGKLTTAGGRVLSVVGRGTSYAKAMTRAYVGALQVSFDGMQYRRDIGRQALLLEASSATQ